MPLLHLKGSVPDDAPPDGGKSYNREAALFPLMRTGAAAVVLLLVASAADDAGGFHNVYMKEPWEMAP